MTSETSQFSHDHVATERNGFSPGTVLFGLILLFSGVLWLLDIGDVIDITWTVAGSGILILIGLLLITIARRDDHGAVVFLGIVLSVVVLLGSLVNWPSMQGGAGAWQVEPESITEVDDSYSRSLGSLTIDLRGVDFPDGETAIEIQHGVGSLKVWIPREVDYHVEWSVGVGNADVLSSTSSGFSQSGVAESPGFAGSDQRIRLTIQLGVGPLEVRE